MINQGVLYRSPPFCRLYRLAPFKMAMYISDAHQNWQVEIVGHVMLVTVKSAAAGVLCFLALGIKEKMDWDDSLDVIAVHLIGGIVGTLLLGFFADTAIGYRS